MIPYDDLVAALSAWRARQGLPVNQVGGSGPTPIPGSGPHGTPGSGPHNRSGSHSVPPPPPSSSNPEMLAATDPVEEVAEELLDEGVYENEGNDFAMSFGAEAQMPAESDATAIGEAPERPTEADLDNNDRDDW